MDALGGAPGVRSARFAADSGLVDSPDANDNTDVWNNMVLLQRLAGVPAAQRTARYRCVWLPPATAQPLQTAEGAVEGMILEAPRGTGGFGYDPLFYLPELDQTMAESTSKPSSRSAIAAAPSRRCCRCCASELPAYLDPRSQMRGAVALTGVMSDIE